MLRINKNYMISLARLTCGPLPGRPHDTPALLPVTAATKVNSRESGGRWERGGGMARPLPITGREQSAAEVFTPRGQKAQRSADAELIQVGGRAVRVVELDRVVALVQVDAQ